jgi:hypothetical protein
MRKRLRILIEDWGLSAPSAVLTVLYPKEFTICDVRASSKIAAGKFRWLGGKTSFKKIWERFEEFKRAVETESKDLRRSLPPSLVLKHGEP